MITANIDEFIASQKRYRCERLSSTLTQEHCDHNRKSEQIVSCHDCPGLDKEETTMSTRITCRECGRENMTLAAKGLCGSCYAKARKAEQNPLADVKLVSDTPVKTAIPPNGQTVQRYPLSVVQEAESDTESPATEEQTETERTVEPATSYVVNLVELFKQKQAKELAAFCAELSKLDNDLARLEFVLMCVHD